MTDFQVGDTLHFLFTTRAFATGVPTVLAGTPVLSAYEDASLTQITAGVSLGVDHDSVVGLNLATIVATGANGFETGKNYSIVITTGTVGGVSVVGEVVESFSLGRSAAAQDLANGTDGLGALKALIDTIDDFLDTEIAAILVDTGTTLQAELDAIQAAVITNAAGDDIAADIIALKAETAAIVADSDELQGDWADGGRLDLLIDAIKAVTDLLNAADSEPTGVPAANETPLVKLAYLFMALRNKVLVSATKKQFFDDGGTVEWEKDLADDGTDYTESEANIP